MQKIFLFVLLSFILSTGNSHVNSIVIDKSPVSEEIIDQSIALLLQKHGDKHLLRVEKGVKQTASLWRDRDGNEEEFMSFAEENFIADEAELEMVFERIANNFEYLFGYMDRISIELNRQTQEDKGPMHKIDQYFSAYNASSHVQEDLYQNKIAFIITLNFPNLTLQEKNTLGANWDDRQWGYARLGDVFTSRVPASVLQNMSKVASEGDMYISEYNIFAGQLIDQNGKKLFPDDMKLLAHWNIRDEIKSNYAKTDGLPKQEMLYKVMLQIIGQNIPKQFINNVDYQWNPFE
jgi:hypothetical protein